MKRRTFIKSIGMGFLSYVIPFRYEEPEQMLDISSQNRTYFVDGNKGNDKNSGLSFNNAWKTIDHVWKTSDKIIIRNCKF